MKVLKFFTILIVLILGIMVFSCKKDRIEKSKAEYSDVNQYLDSKKQEEQVFIIDTTGPGPIVGEQGTKIWISKNCLMKPNGDTITYPYIVKLVELYTPMDMIYYQMPSTSSQGILETDGEIRLRAYKDDEELVLKPYPCHCVVSMPNDEPQSYMSVYYGYETNNKPDWTNDLSIFGIDSHVNPNFMPTDTGYVAQVERLGWLACDSVAGDNTGAKLSFVSSTDELENIGIFIYIPETRTVMQVYDLISGYIPTGSSVKVICIGLHTDGNLYHFYQEIDVNADNEIEVEMQEISDSDLTVLLENL